MDVKSKANTFDGIVIRNEDGSNEFSSEGLGSASTDGNDDAGRVQERLIVCRICDKKWLMKVSAR